MLAGWLASLLAGKSGRRALTVESPTCPRSFDTQFPRLGDDEARMSLFRDQQTGEAASVPDVPFGTYIARKWEQVQRKGTTY